MSEEIFMYIDDNNLHPVTYEKRAIKKEVVRGFGGKCGYCGISYDDCVYDLHHINPDTKEHDISHLILSTKQRSIIYNESKKCILLCSNCHRKVHKGVIGIPVDIQRFDVDLASNGENLLGLLGYEEPKYNTKKELVEGLKVLSKNKKKKYGNQHTQVPESDLVLAMKTIN